MENSEKEEEERKRSRGTGKTGGVSWRSLEGLKMTKICCIKFSRN